MPIRLRAIVEPITPQAPAWRMLLVALGGSAAGLLGLLYGLGAVVELARLKRADVAILDGLPLIPLPHLLTAGIGLSFSTVFWVIVLTTFISGLGMAERALSEGKTRALIHKRAKSLKTRAFSFKSEIRLQREGVEAHQESTRRIKEFAGQPPPTIPDTAEERGALAAQMDELKEELRTYDVGSKRTMAEFRRLKRAWRIGHLLMTCEMGLLRSMPTAIRYGPLALAVLIGVFVVPPVVAASLILCGVVWRLALRLERPRFILVFLNVILAVGIVANAVINVTPLPVGHVSTTAARYRGNLISLTDTAWYLASPNGVIRAIPTDHATEGYSVSAQVKPTETIFELLV